ncbi:hypothetical protein Patl1_08372 [Pistacia atlantica]|uniref:Uncharacterized protein n=1 Tax=Pistacia atlantica TaxID=434234 RepID=A0ACC1AK56_9ROSI|nr:hypothetical protein Patl1_08372 [Pistacia atlantica]
MNNVHGYGEESNCGCYFHPKEVVVGVCPLCLNEKLLVLAAKQGHRSSSSARTSHHRNSSTNKINVSDNKKPPIHLPKIFALGSLLNRFEFRHWKSDISDDHDACSSSSQEDSFISIKFEDNGVASWEKANTVSNKVSLENCSMYWNNNQNTNTKEFVGNNKSVIEHAKAPRGSSLRWRKRIGHLLQLVRWKRSNKGNVCQVDHGVKVRKGWIRSLTKRGPKNK